MDEKIEIIDYIENVVKENLGHIELTEYVLEDNNGIRNYNTKIFIFKNDGVLYIRCENYNIGHSYSFHKYMSCVENFSFIFLQKIQKIVKQGKFI